MYGAVQLAVAVQCSRNAGETTAILVARVNQSLAGRNLSTETLALRTIGVVVYGIGTVTGKFGNSCILDIRIRDTISNHYRRKIDPQHALNWSKFELLVLLVDDRSKVRYICSTIALCRKMEGCLRIFGVTVQEEFQERVDIVSCNGTGANRGTVVRVRKSNVDGLVQEDDVGVRVPRVRVVFQSLSFFINSARTQLEEESS